MKILPIAAKVGVVYFFLFSIFYIGRSMYAYQLFRQYHSTPTGINIAYTILKGSAVFEESVAITESYLLFKGLAVLAVLGAGIWLYQTARSEKPATVS